MVSEVLIAEDAGILPERCFQMWCNSLAAIAMRRNALS
ncbi:hypothetical protein AC519_2552 [Pseudomonas savastanoi]|nr:hypothetical protein AC519_2552 [Pseudomonas savastanoi]